jgi:hypothetical protein
MGPKSHTQLTRQSQTLRGGNRFGHHLVQYGADDAAMNNPFESFPAGRGRPLGANAAIGTGIEFDPQTMRMIGATHNTTGLGTYKNRSDNRLDR